MPSPIPDPNALRRDRKDDASWTSLPIKARVSPTPQWPLVGQSEREEELWEMYWGKPQSLLWKHNSQEMEVALFVRRLTEVEVINAPATLHVLLMRQMDTLLLTIPAMYKAHVKIVADEVAAKREEKESTKAKGSIRDRVKAVNDGDA